MQRNNTVHRYKNIKTSPYEIETTVKSETIRSKYKIKTDHVDRMDENRLVKCTKKANNEQQKYYKKVGR